MQDRVKCRQTECLVRLKPGVGGAVLSVAFGPEVFADFLEGAAAEDKLSTNKDALQNPAML